MSKETFVLVLQILQFVVSLGLIAVCVKLIQQNRQFAKERKEQAAPGLIPDELSYLFKHKKGWCRKQAFGQTTPFTGRPIKTPTTGAHQNDDLIDLLQKATKVATEQSDEELDELGNVINPTPTDHPAWVLITNKRCSTYKLLKPGDIVASQIHLVLCGQSSVCNPVVTLTVGDWWQTIELTCTATKMGPFSVGKLSSGVEQSDSDKNTFYFTVPFWVDATTVEYYQGYVNHVGLTTMQFHALLNSLVPEIVLAIVEFKKQTGVE